MADDYDKSVENLRDDVHELRTIIDNLTKDLKGAARGKVRRGENWLREAVDDARDYTANCYHEAHKQVETHPLTSVFSALGIGMLLGKLLLRR